MKMLEAGGVDLLTDNIRKADIDNPKGYFEYEKVKDLKHNASWLAEAKGKCIKIISMLLYFVPPIYRYKIIFMQRNINEIIASQEKMLKRSSPNHENINNDILFS